MKIAITGENGFLGYHLTQYYKWIKEYEVVSLGRNYLDNIDKLADCDLLIHCAGVNRGDDVYNGNVNLAKDLVEALTNNNISIQIKFTSSTQEDLGNEYGNSKLEAKRILSEYCKQVGKKFESYKLPNLFGPFGKPYYNSFVATFCHNVVNGFDIQSNENQVALCYVQDAVETIVYQSGHVHNYPTTSISVNDVRKLIETFHKNYDEEGIITQISDKFSKDMFNTYRSYREPKVFDFTKHTDDRGSLVELVRGKGSESHVFFSTTKPGVTRGNHFHFGKVERFCVLSGKANVQMRKVGTDQVLSFDIEGGSSVIDMPILYTHNLTNTGDTELVCVFWVNEVFDKENPDTYFNVV